MRGVVVHDQMQVRLLWRFGVDQFQKLDPLLMPMAIHAFTDESAFGYIQSREQCRGTIALVAVSHGTAPTLFQW